MTSHSTPVRQPENPKMEAPPPASTGPTREEIRANRKLAKQQKKLMKKSKMEEDFLRSLRGPKDTKVVLADRSFVEKWMTGGGGGGPTSPATARTFSARDFPALGPSATSSPTPTGKSVHRRQAVTYKSVVDASVPDEFFPLVRDVKVEPGLTEDRPQKTKEEEPPPPPEPPEDPPKPKIEPPVDPNLEKTKTKTKKKDPIVLSIDDLITKSTKTDNKRVRTSKIRRFSESDALCGNMLDSSSPKRSRGKHREIEKVRITKLKQAIIRDRVKKARVRGSLSAEDLLDAKLFSIELGKYLSKLLERRAKIAERRRTRAGERRSESRAEEGKTTGAECEKTAEVRPPEEEKRKTKYRKYCDNKYHRPLDSSVEVLIKGLVYLQDRAFAKDPIKARAKRRHVVGLREVKKYLNLKKVRMVILAPDLEAQETVYEVIEGLKQAAALQNIPCVFALDRRRLGYVTKKNIPVSAVGILHYDGLEEKFAAVKENLMEAREVLQTFKSDGVTVAEEKPDAEPA